MADQGDVALEYLSPLTDDGPKYGCTVLVRAPARFEQFELMTDMPSPERAAMASVNVEGRCLRVGSWAAPPGVTWGRAGKGRQVNRFAAWLRDRPGPTVVGIDRNAPKWERHDLAGDESWNRREPLLYGPDRVHDLRDAYRDCRRAVIGSLIAQAAWAIRTVRLRSHGPDNRPNRGQMIDFQNATYV